MIRKRQNYSFRCCAVTHIGNHRKNNEDNFYIGDGRILLPGQQQSMMQAQNCCIAKTSCFDNRQNRLYAVSDGMGGLQNGEVASLEAVRAMDAFSRMCSEMPGGRRGDKFEIIESLQNAIFQLNAKIIGLSKTMEGGGMGATLCGLLFFSEEVVPFNIGDSSIFLYEGGTLRKLTVDDNEAERFKDRDMALNGNGRGLTKYLGMAPSCGALTARISSPVPLRTGQTFLISSDGLTDCLNRAELEWLHHEENDEKQLAGKLVEAALATENGGHDNITVVVIKVVQKARRG